jgi:heme exporter protein C
MMMNELVVNHARLDRVIRFFNIATAVALPVALLVIFFYAPVERTMGNVQRLFYFHVGSAWVGAASFFVALLAGVLYLRRPQARWDAVAVAAVEVGLVFLIMATVAGSVWGRPAWNTWWLWSPRLTLITVAILTYAAYFMLRGAIDEEERRGRFAAVYVILAFVTVLMAYLSTRILRDIHPVVFGGTLESAQGAAEGLQEFSGIDSLKMVLTLNVAVVTFTLLGAAWFFTRIRLQLLTNEANVLKQRVASSLSDRPVVGSLVSGIAIALLQPAADPNNFNSYLILGYFIMWLVGMAYVSSLALRQRNIQQDLLLMNRLLQETDGRQKG